MDYLKSSLAPKGFLSRFDSNTFIARFSMYSSDLLVAVTFFLLGSGFFVDIDEGLTLISSNLPSSSLNI